jgi:hypothetical protein
VEDYVRYPAGKLPEILDAYSRNGHYFASFRLMRDGDDRVFELGISASSYAALRRVIQSRPFGQTPGSPRRYLFVPSCSKRDDPQRCIGTVRVEQGRDGKNIDFEMPADLIANLLWFYEMETLAPTQHLRSWPPSEA